MAVCAIGLVTAAQGGPQPSRDVPAYLAEKLAKKLRGGPADGLQPFTAAAEAQEYFVMKRAAAGEAALPFERYVAALRHMDSMPQYASASGVELLPRAAGIVPEGFASPWTELGPGNIGGRTRGIAIDPTNPDVMYVAGVAGGVWKTANGGASWTPLDDFMANLAVSSLAMDPADPNVLYAGTGEGYFNGDAVRGAGIFKTTDGGATWAQLAATNNSNFHYVNNLIVSDNNSLNVYSATRTGVWRSLDGGVSWTKVLDGALVNGCMDLDARTDTATDYVFAACGTFTQSTIYRNTDAGGSGVWTAVYSEAGMGRTTLAIAPSNQNVIYALSASVAVGTFQHGLHAVFRSTASGDAGTWTAQVRNTSPTPLNRLLLSNTVYGSYNSCFGGGVNYFYNQGWYDNVIAVDPVNSDRVWVGGIDVFRSTDGGANWGVASRWWAGGPAFDHADQHGIVFHPAYNGTTNQTMYSLNDGGLYRTTNAASGTTSTSTFPGSFICGGPTPAGMVNWTELNNNYRVTQFYNGVPYPDGMSYFGGTQDNGTVRGTDAGGIDGWSMIQGGDGGYVAVNPTNTNILYAEFTGISIHKSTNGGVTWAAATTGISDSGLFINPFVMDPSNPDTLWTGGAFPWRTTNAAGSWTKAGTSFGSNVSAIAVASTNSNRVVMGTHSGSIRLTTAALTANSGTAWSATTPRAGYVSSVAFDPSNELLVYATYSTFGGSHVWRSTDGGATFTAIDGAGATSIPDIPVHSIVVDPGNSVRLYVGTDLGVFVSRDTGATWAVENTGFANVITETLAVGNVSGVPHIFAFTHGRGTFRVPPIDSGLPSVTISATDDTATEAGPTTGTYTVSRTGSTASALTVFYTVGGTATSGSDYTALSGSVTIPAGSSSAPIDVTPINDALVEPDETVIATLSADPAYTAGAPSSATVTITSDDTGTPPDLSISALKPPAVGGAGLAIAIKDTTLNAAAAGAAPSTSTGLYLSANNVWDGGDVLLGSRVVPPLAAGISSTATTNVTIPAGTPTGKWFIIARADNGATVAESNEANNTVAKVIYIGPDLTIKKLIGPASATRGTTVLLDITTTNVGGAAIGDTTTRIYLSTNTKVDATDDLLGSIAVPSLGKGLSHVVTGFSVTIPAGTATGPRYFIAVADDGNLRVESRETNNLKKQAVTINP